MLTSLSLMILAAGMVCFLFWIEGLWKDDLMRVEAVNCPNCKRGVSRSKCLVAFTGAENIHRERRICNRCGVMFDRDALTGKILRVYTDLSKSRGSL